MQTENYLQLSRDVVNALVETEGTQVVQLNKGQCKLLKEKLLQTMRRIGEDLDSLACTELAIFTQRCKGALQQLYRTVKDTEAIIHSCCRPKAAIKLTNINEACAQVLFQLDWCTAICLDGRLAVTASKSQRYVTKNIEGFGADECKLKMKKIHSILLGHLDRSKTTLEPELSKKIQPAVKESVASLSKLEMSAPLNDEQRTKRLDLLSIEPQELQWIRRIGSGSFGTVHEVCWQGESFAQKYFQSKASLEQEAEILAGLSHPNIVQVFGHCIGGKSSLVMELMNGNLTDHIEHRAQVLNEPSLELAVALDIMLQIAEGMQYLHEKRVAHRDLKSANILINPVQILGMENAGYAQVKLADFGLSKIKEGSATYSIQTANRGTTRWMAPELFGEPDPNECRYPFKADVYSYAITCFEILTAKFPFEDTASNTEVRRKVKAGERPVLPVTLPMFLSSLIERCWDAEANRRPSFSEICAELRHFQGVIMISDLATKLRDASGYPCQTFVVPRHLPKYTFNGDVMVDRQLQNFEDPHRRMLDFLRHGMEPFASAGLSKPTGFNTKPTWSHIEETNTPDDFNFSVAVAAGNDKEGNTDEDTPNVGPPYFSPFEILVQLLINSDLPAKIAIFQLLLDQRCSVPLLVSHSNTYYTHFKTEQIIHRLSDGLSYLGDVLDFVTVKLANQEILSISEDRILPRVVFVSDRKVLSSRETPDMASDVMNCQFISKHIKRDTGDGPIVEVGVGFLATPGDEARKYMPCLVLCVWGDHDQLGEFLEKVADIVIVETEPTQQPRVLSWAGEHQHVLYWNINSTGRSSNKNGKDMICGSFKNLTRYIGKSLMNEISKKKFKGSKGGATSLRECLPRQIQLLNPKVTTSNVTHLDGTNLGRVKDDFVLQKSFAREAKNFFESLRLRGEQAELKQRQNQIQQEKEYRASAADKVMRLPIIADFICLLKEKHYLKRKIGIVQFELSINKKLRPTLEKAAKKVDDAFDAFRQQPENLELKQMYYRAKGEHVDQMLGLEHLWRELSHMFAADPSTNGDLPMLAAQHLVDGFPLEILGGDVAMFHKLWVERVLVELNKCLHAVLERDPKVLVLSIIGVQSSGKSTLLNLMFGTQLKTSAGQCTRGVYLQVVKSEWSDYDYVLLLDTEGIRAPEYFGLKGAQLHDNRLATFTVLPVDACIVMVGNEEDSGLKEVLPMVMLAFNESAMAEEHGGQMQAKLFFVYRSVDTNDTKKLLMNQRKLQEDLRQASHEIANLQINEVEEGGSQVRQPPSTLDSLQKFRIDSDEEKSDVKFFGNLKKSNVPPFDVPDDEYGNKVVKLRKYINNRVLHGGWESHGLKAWTKYLCMVWDCIADANFLNRIEYAHYLDLLTKLTGCQQIVGRKWLEEFKILEGTPQGAIRSNLEMSTTVLMQTLESKVEDTIKEETREVDKFLQQKQYQKWKVEGTSRWDDFCSGQKRHWMKCAGELV
ncbi:unnamed protein product [Sphagnum jensenii]|uniref:Protein kinase domain-containing protein n=1 Tax=Sphagnum jensenii TaxID=128206 RepID=A0ABP0W175_9BRYO